MSRAVLFDGRPWRVVSTKDPAAPPVRCWYRETAQQMVALKGNPYDQIEEVDLKEEERAAKQRKRGISAEHPKPKLKPKPKPKPKKRPKPKKVKA